MTNIWFTADCHFNHSNIIKYANRPFFKRTDLDADGYIEWKSERIKKNRAEWMNEILIDNWNELVDKDDLVYHLGDFCFRGSRGVSKELEDKLNGDIVHIQGNHDMNNGVKTYLKRGVLEFGGKVVYAIHRPPRMAIEIPEWCDFVICGHIHDKWKYKIINNIPIINVGVDVWNYRPVSTNALLKFYREVKGHVYREQD